MGLKTSKQIAKEQIRARNLREIQSMYKMFDETIDVVKKSRLLLSNYDRSKGLVSFSKMNINNSKINNLQDVIEQLTSSFKDLHKYTWSTEIYKQFKKHFTDCFQQVWPINKQEFYQIILAQCKFQTIDFQNQLQEVANQLHMSLPNRRSYQQLFYEVGTSKLQQHLPSSFIYESDGEWSEDFAKQNQEEKAQFNLNAINATIINNDHNPDHYIDSYYQVKQEQDDEAAFLPLFLKTEARPKSIIKTENQNQIKTAQKQFPVLSKEQRKQMRKLQQARIQSSSLIMPETIFLKKMTESARQEIGDLVKFYRQFGNALQRLFFSVSLISSPFKHFIFIFNQKMNRKNIKQKRLVRSNSVNSSSFQSRNTILQELLYGESQEAVKYRQTRQLNNNFILDQIRDFTQAYTDFIWKYLQLSDITELKLGKMISIQNLYGIVLKSVWRFVEFISDRGCQYQEWKIQQYYKTQDVPNRTKLKQQKKKYLMRVLKRLLGQHNPQKYLKKIVIFYRQASACGTCADDLLNIYEQLIVKLIKQGFTRQLGIFRMRNVIQKLLKIDENYSGGGEIGYSWTTWLIITEILLERIKGKLSKHSSQLSQMKTQLDDMEYQYADLRIN